LALIEENKSVVLARAQALINHPERTLNIKEIDAAIAETLKREAKDAERARPADGGRSPSALPRSRRKGGHGNMAAGWRSHHQASGSRRYFWRHSLTRNNVMRSERNPASRVMYLR
jgi:hypothetical protein